MSIQLNLDQDCQLEELRTRPQRAQGVHGRRGPRFHQKGRQSRRQNRREILEVGGQVP